MKKRLLFLFALCSVAVLPACSSVQVAQNLNGQSLGSGTSVAHVNVTAAGWYFLSFPLITGSLQNPGSLVFGEDTCTVGPAVKATTAKIASMKASKAEDLTSRASGFNLPVPIPFLFSIKKVNVSANATK